MGLRFRKALVSLRPEASKINFYQEKYSEGYIQGRGYSLMALSS